MHWPDLPYSGRCARLSTPGLSQSRSPGCRSAPISAPALKLVAPSTALMPPKDTNHSPGRRRTSSDNATRTRMTPSDPPLQAPVQRPASCIIPPMRFHTANSHPTYKQALGEARATPPLQTPSKPEGRSTDGCTDAMPTPTLAIPPPSPPSHTLMFAPPTAETCDDDSP